VMLESIAARFRRQGMATFNDTV